jgi:hypothetical protein
MIYKAMEKSIFFRLNEVEHKLLEDYCKINQRTKSDVLRELIRSLELKKKPS